MISDGPKFVSEAASDATACDGFEWATIIPGGSSDTHE
jgi:hypothetical protein